jgi:hypothetical protein
MFGRILNGGGNGDPPFERKALAGEAPRFEKGKGSGAKEDPSPASSLILLLEHSEINVKGKILPSKKKSGMRPARWSGPS